MMGLLTYNRDADVTTAVFLLFCVEDAAPLCPLQSVALNALRVCGGWSCGVVGGARKRRARNAELFDIFSDLSRV